jgi:hypothetical protein
VETRGTLKILVRNLLEDLEDNIKMNLKEIVY